MIKNGKKDNDLENDERNARDELERWGEEHGVHIIWVNTDHVSRLLYWPELKTVIVHKNATCDDIYCLLKAS